MFEFWFILEYYLGLILFGEINLKNLKIYLKYFEMSCDVLLYVILVFLRKKLK